jgi:dihydrolipoamide dehydrogenase
VAGAAVGGVKHLMKKNKVTVFDGDGKLAGAGKVAVTKDGKAVAIAAKNIILATGARARVARAGADGKLVWTYKEAMVPDRHAEVAAGRGLGRHRHRVRQLLPHLGAEVTVVEVLDRVLPVEDEESRRLARKAFEKQGMKILTGAKVKV